MRSSLFPLVALTLLVGVTLSLPATAQTEVPSEIEIRAANCSVRYKNRVNVSAKSEGTLVALHFEEGATLDEGELMAVIDDTAAKLAVEHKKAEEKEAVLNAANEVNLKDAINSEELASAEAKAYYQLLEQRAIPFWEHEKKRLEAKRAKLRIDLAKMQKKIAEAQMIAKFSEVKIAEHELSQRQVTAPSTGFIETRIAQLGEWVQPGSPIATLIQMDKLRVEGDFNGLRYPGEIVKGTPVQVMIYTQGTREDYYENPDLKPYVVNAKLGYVSMEVDLNQRYRAWVEVENRKVGEDWLLKPGMEAEIVIRRTGRL